MSCRPAYVRILDVNEDIGKDVAECIEENLGVERFW